MTSRSPSALSACERGRRRLLDRIADGNRAGQLAIDAQEDDGATLPPELHQLASRMPSTSRRSPASVQRCPERAHDLPPGRARPALSRTRIAHRGRLDAARLRAGDDGTRQRMLARAIEPGSPAQNLLLRRSRSTAMTRSKAGLPTVIVPVLSSTNVSTLRRFSIACAS